MSAEPAVVLTIAGSDSGGGAGIQGDLKTFSTLGVFGTTAITAITAQNTVAVTGVMAVSADFLRAQLDAVLSDLPVAAVKTGMLANSELVEVVADYAQSGKLPNLVVDPVMVASSGARLLDNSAQRAYIDRLLPYALVATPNLPEAEALTGQKIESLAQMERAALSIAGLGPRAVVVKGGHANDRAAVDIVACDGETFRLESPRTNTTNTHGTGCSFAAATATGLAIGMPLRVAIESAKQFVALAIAGADEWSLGAGHGPIDHAGAGLLQRGQAGAGGQSAINRLNRQA